MIVLFAETHAGFCLLHFVFLFAKFVLLPVSLRGRHLPCDIQDSQRGPHVGGWLGGRVGVYSPWRTPLLGAQSSKKKLFLAFPHFSTPSASASSFSPVLGTCAHVDRHGLGQRPRGPRPSVLKKIPGQKSGLPESPLPLRTILLAGLNKVAGFSFIM